MTDQQIINAARCACEATRLALAHSPPVASIDAYHAGFVAGIITLCLGLGIPLRLDSNGVIQKRLLHADPRASG